MKPATGSRSALRRDQRGSVLYLVLALFVIATFIFAIGLQAHVYARSRFNREHNKLQAAALAYSGISIASARLSGLPRFGANLKPDTLSIKPSEASIITVVMERQGGYIQARSTGQYRNQRKTFTAVLGEEPGSAFSGSVCLTNPGKDLTLARGSRIEGTVFLPQNRIIKMADRKGFRPHGNAFRGKVRQLNPDLIDETAVTVLDSQLAVFARSPASKQPQPKPASTQAGWAGNIRLLSDSFQCWAVGSLRLGDGQTLGTEKQIQGRRLYVLGDLCLTGNSRASKLHAYVTGNVELRDSSRMSDCDLSCLGELKILDKAWTDSRFVAAGGIHVAGNARLDYPSFLYLSSHPSKPRVSNGSRLQILGNASVQGTVATSAFLLQYERDLHRSRIELGPAVRVTGLIFTPLALQPEGKLSGSIRAYEGTYLEKFTIYPNWFVAGEISSVSLTGFVAPRLFQKQARIAPLRIEDAL